LLYFFDGKETNPIALRGEYVEAVAPFLDLNYSSYSHDDLSTDNIGLGKENIKALLILVFFTEILFEMSEVRIEINNDNVESPEKRNFTFTGKSNNDGLEYIKTFLNYTFSDIREYFTEFTGSLQDIFGMQGR